MTQLELHKKIEEFFKTEVDSANVEIAKDLIKENPDAKLFFFSKADDSWLDWLWKEGFLDKLKEKLDDSSPYRMPELEYLARMVEKKSSEVAKIIDSVKISEDNFNPEVTDQFLWIIELLPVEQIKMLAIKIKEEKWVYFMRDFSKTGYEFEKIVNKLFEAKESAALLEIAPAILTIKTKEDIAKKSTGFSTDGPFYINDIQASGIFDALVNIEDSYVEKALQVVVDIMKEILKLAKPDDDEKRIFDFVDPFSLFDVDFFTLDFEDKRTASFREDVKNLAATIKKLIDRTIGKKCSEVSEAKRLFGYIEQLPLCRSVWRLRLFALAQCPKVFIEELKQAFFKLFEVENYYEIVGGTEYRKALSIAFPYLSEVDQRDYVTKVFQYFSDKAKQDPDKAWHKRTGWEILSSICNYLKVDELKRCEEIFDKRCNEKYEPEPMIGKMHSGSVSSISPINPSDYSVEQIVTNLKIKWTPEKLSEQFKNDDFFKPRDADGLGNSLKEDFKKRTDEYLKNINSFFDRNTIHPHYLFSLLCGIEELLRDKQSLDMKQIDQVFGLFEVIKNNGKNSTFERKEEKDWLADWITVHKMIADILILILEDKEKRLEIHKEHKDQTKDLISYLLTIKSSPSKDDEKPEYGEPYHIAINSVRGQAYLAFVLFTENDGKNLSDDTKKIFKETLNDDSFAVRFVIGRYLATFYFRDKNFIVGLFPEIFPKDNSNKKDIYLATWEGYLSNTLYDELFTELKDYYSYAITLDPENYTQRNYLKGLDETLAIHFALAFAYLGLKIEDPLFTQFWSKQNIKRHQEFISFIGRSCLTRDNTEDKIDKSKFIKFWDWVLANPVVEPESLSGFGFWINRDKEILDDETVIKKMAETLKKYDGNIDWDYGLLKRLCIFTEKDKEKTLEVITSYLLDSKGGLNQKRNVPFLYHPEIKESLKLIYKNSDEVLRQKVVDLINVLIKEGSRPFWDLKEILN